MTIPIAFEAKQSGSKNLSGFTDTQVLTLTLSALPPNPNAKNPQPNRYVIFGRVVVRNLDGSPQNAGASMQDFAGNTLDRVDLRIAADDSTPDPTQAGGQSISLLATFELTPYYANPVVYIYCGTYNGTAEEARLIAVSVDGFAPGTSAPDVTD